MLMHRIQRRVSRELATHFIKRQSRSALRGRYISICFDDFPESAAVLGGKILQNAGGRGTYYLAAGLLNSDSPVGRIAGMESARSLVAAGHELGCHTFGHKDCTLLTRRELAQSLDANQDMVDFCRFESFAYPFGYSDWNAKAVVSNRFRTVRTATKGINQGHVDLAGLKSLPLYAELGLEAADRGLDLLGQSDGWLILYTHDVAVRPSRFGCTPKMLEHCVMRAGRLGCAVETVRMVASRLD